MKNWKELNYSKGFSRMYNLLWGICVFALIANVVALGKIPSYYWQEVLLVGIGPYFYKKAFIWLAQGFLEKT